MFNVFFYSINTAGIKVAVSVSITNAIATNVVNEAFSALTPLVGRQEGLPACKN